MNRRKLFLILLFITPIYLVPQSIVDLALKDKSRISIQKWNEDSGLPSNDISDLLISKQGFLWIGTEFGLARFDGAEIKNYNLLNTPEIKANKVLDLYEDKNGSLWFANGTGGMVKYFNGVFKRYGIENGLPENNCSGIVEDKSGTFWIGTRGGGLVFIKGNFIKIMNSENGFPSNRITAIAKDKDDNIWVGTNNKGVVKINKNGLVVYDEYLGLPNKFVYDLFVDSSNRVWVFFSEGAAIIENGKVVIPDFLNRFQKTAITSIAEDKRGRVCITTVSAAYALIGNEFVEFFNVGNSKEVRLQEMLIWNDDIWFGTKEAGILRLRTNKVQNISAENGLPGKVVSAIFQDSQNRIWIGSEKKLILYDQNKKKAIKIFDLPASDILSFCELNPNKILIGTRTSGLWEINNFQIRKLAGKNELGSNLIRTIIKKGDGSVVIGTNGNGIVLLKDKSFQIINKDKGLSSNLVSCITRDNLNQLWVGTTGGGINILNGNNKPVVINKAKSLAHNNVTSIIHDGKVVWVATNGGGLSRISQNRIINFTINNGLYENRIFNMADDGNGRLWFTTKKGIFVISKDQLNEFAAGKIAKVNYQLFTKTEGMLSDECQTLTMQTVLIQHSQLLAATTSGISIISFANLASKEIAPKVFVDEIKINSRTVPLDSSMSYMPGTENLEIHYSGISFDHGKNLSFYYKLIGLDDKWTSVGSRRAAYFTHLPPGKYSFLVKAETPQGTESISPASITFSIEPYLYQRIWFQILLAFLLIGVVAGIVRFISVRKLRLKLERIEAQAALERERMRISKDMHDELGAELTKIGLLSEIAKNNFRSSSQNLEVDLDRITEASRDVAITMDEIVWAVNPKNDKIDRLCGYIANYVQEYLSLTDIHLTLKVPDTLQEVFMSAELRHNVFLVIKEAANNIVKHSKAKEVFFNARYCDNNLEFTLSDDGIGIIDSVDEFGNGLINMRKRMKDHGGYFEIKSNTPKGTIVKISVPIINHTIV
ncbi:MAG: two-component regulator propeller domain-containing protein [Ignavibacteria bacterium]|nr:two-component regulator propeller domain-containing protein [Ignavibacteria bacterium]